MTAFSCTSRCHCFSLLFLFYPGYTLVFKAVSGINEDVRTTYKSAAAKNEHVTDAMDVTDNFKGNYKNRIGLDANWKIFDPSFVRIF